MVTTNPAGLTPIEIGQGVTYKEAKLTSLYKKVVSASIFQRGYHN